MIDVKKLIRMYDPEHKHITLNNMTEQIELK